MPLISTSTGGLDIEDGVYPVTVVAIGPDKMTPTTGPNAGIEGDIFRWKFQLEDPETGEPLEIERITSQSTGPKSKVVEFLVALLGAKAGEPNQNFEERDLVGKQALAKIVRNEAGYTKIETLTAMPRAARGTVRTAVAAPVEEPGDDLPF